MSVKSIIPGTAEHSQKHAQKYYQRLVKGHDVVLEIEWPDGTVTYDSGDFSVEDDAYVSSKGLKFFVNGKGSEPRTLHGVPMVRVSSAVAASVDTSTAIAMGQEEEGEYEDVTTDAGEVVDREYDLRPPEGMHGWTYYLSDATDRAPYPTTSMEMKDQEERGKMSARSTADNIKYLLMGMGIVLGGLFLIAVLGIAGAKVLGLAFVVPAVPKGTATRLSERIASALTHETPRVEAENGASNSAE